jgi:uncharacterized protein YhaN
MRLALLQLIAYGPFREREIDFSGRGLHVVFGRNEAGKSTTLRAITGLLYGIDRHTQDAHVHKGTDLRIGGVIEGDTGELVRIVRRKGNANTLLDANGNTLDDAVVQRLLRGVSHETFKNAFGLDHVTLQSGAKALLEGKGDLGESIFDASVGGGGDVQRLLAELTEEADAIYRPRGSTLPLNEALREFADAQKLVRERQSLPEAYLAQQRALDDARANKAKAAAQRAEVATRRARIDRARRLLPLASTTSSARSSARRAIAASLRRRPIACAIVWPKRRGARASPWARARRTSCVSMRARRSACRCSCSSARRSRSASRARARRSSARSASSRAEATR